MGKAKREAKKARRENKELLEQQRVEMERLRKRRRILVAAVPVVTGAIAAGLWFGLESGPLTGAALLGGAVVWLLMGLGYLGAGVSPRDRDRAGSIDFGNR